MSPCARWQFDPADSDYSFVAKVMLLSSPNSEELQEKTCNFVDKDSKDRDELVHPTRALKFLVGLKEKRAEQVAVQGRNIPERDVRSFFPEAKHISVKGEAPLLMPHPGNNMTPMTDDAIQKQSKLRNLRNEMLTVSYTCRITLTSD